MHPTHSTARQEQAPPARWLLYVLVAAVFITGGNNRDPGLDDAAVQLLALVLIVAATWRLLRTPPAVLGKAGIAIACAVLLLPLLQLLPLSPGSWQASPARAALAADLHLAGATPDHHWSLAPAASWRAWAALLPAFAAFLGVLAFARTKTTQRSLLRLLVALALGSLLLGFLQLGVPQDSLLNPFPELPPVLNGVFANQNHQGSMLAAALAVSLAGLLQALRTEEAGRPGRGWRLGGWAFAAAACLLALPLTGSRGAVLIAVFVVALVPLAMGAFSPRRLRAGWTARAGLAAAVALVALGLWGTLSWMQVDAVAELRAPLRAATAALAGEHLPWGTGVGAFVPAFAQAIPDGLLRDAYVNHAHNEYLQWWSEAGWLALAAGAAVAALLLAAAARLVRGWRQAPRAVVVGSAGVLLVLLAHGFVDYPLRTPALMTVAAVAAALLLQIASQMSGREKHFRTGTAVANPA